MSRGEIRKELCNELARLLAIAPAGRAVRLLQWTDLLGQREVPPQTVPPQTVPPQTVPPKTVLGASAPGPREALPGRGDGTRPISIWQPTEEGGREGFVRPPVGPLGDHFATHRRIDRQKAPGARRVCFFGESVAAGYLYAPHLTPAMVLQAQLRHVLGKEGVEVVDLARTNETLRGLAATAKAARQLEPDAYVVFAGNNWNLLETSEISPYVPSVRGRQEYSAALRDGGLEGPVALADRALRVAVGSAFGALAQAAGDIPILLLEPEVNLDHWEARQPVAWLSGGDTDRWYRELEAGEASLHSGDGSKAAAAARRMVELDGGSCPTPFRLLGRALQRLGELGRAEEAFRREVDAERYPTLCYLGAPRITSGGRTLLRQAAQRFGMHHLSLEELFRDIGGAMPGRRMFLDYCHLTVEGMHVAMAAATAGLLRCWGQDVSPAELLQTLPRLEPSAAVDGVAKLGAAVHGAHRWAGDKGEMLAHWCDGALTATPAMGDVFEDLMAARCAPTPVVLTPSMGRNLASSAPLTLQHGLRWDGLDAELLQAMAQALEGRGVERGSDLDETLIAGTLAIDSSPELTEPRFLWDPLERFYPDVMSFDNLTGRAVLRAPWPETRFCLPALGGLAVAIEIVARLPTVSGAEGARSGNVEVSVNGRQLGAFPLAETWRRHRLRIRTGALRRGINLLSLRWPPLPPIGHLAMEAALRRLDQGIEAEIHPVFAEIYSVRALDSRAD